METPREHYKRIKKLLLGKKPEQVKLGHGSFLTIDFGEKTEKSPGKFESEWMIWIYCCQWEILDDSHNISVHCEDSPEDMALVLNQLQNSPLTELKYDPESFEISLGFANGFSIKLTPNDEYYEDAEYMMIYTPDNGVLAFGPHKTLNYYSATSSPADKG